VTWPYKTLLNLVGGIGLTALGWFGRELWSAVKELKTDLDQVTGRVDLRLMPKGMMSRTTSKRLRQMLTDIYQELRKKADK